MHQLIYNFRGDQYTTTSNFFLLKLQIYFEYTNICRILQDQLRHFYRYRSGTQQILNVTFFPPGDVFRQLDSLEDKLHGFFDFFAPTK